MTEDALPVEITVTAWHNATGNWMVAVSELVELTAVEMSSAAAAVHTSLDIHLAQRGS